MESKSFLDFEKIFAILSAFPVQAHRIPEKLRLSSYDKELYEDTSRMLIFKNLLTSCLSPGATRVGCLIIKNALVDNFGTSLHCLL